MQKHEDSLYELYRLVEIGENIERSKIVKEDMEFVAQNIHYAGQWLLYFFYYYVVNDKHLHRYDFVDVRSKMLKVIACSGPVIKVKMTKLLNKLDRRIKEEINNEVSV